jgi:hypothetical protein
MPIKQFDGRICPRPHNLVGVGECFCNVRDSFCHFWMGRVEMLLPFCGKSNYPIMDIVEKLHGDIYVLLMPNGREMSGTPTWGTAREAWGGGPTKGQLAAVLRSEAP